MQPTAQALGRRETDEPQRGERAVLRTRFATAQLIFLDHVSFKQIIYPYKHYPLDKFCSLTTRLESTGGQVSVGSCPEIGHWTVAHPRNSHVL